MILNQTTGSTSRPRSFTSWFTPQMQQKQQQTKSQIAGQFYNEGQSPSQVLDFINQTYTDPSARGYALQGFGSLAREAGISDDIGADNFNLYEGFYNDLTGQGSASPDILNELDTYQQGFYNASKPGERGFLSKVGPYFVKPAVIAGLGTIAGNIAGGATGFGTLGKAISGATSSTLSGGNPAEGGLYSALTAGISDFLPSADSLKGFAKSAYDAVPSLGEFGNSVAQGALKGGITSGVTGGDPLRGALTGGALGGATELGSQAFDTFSDFFNPQSEPLDPRGIDMLRGGDLLFDDNQLDQMQFDLLQNWNGALPQSRSAQPTAEQVANIEPSAGEESMFSDLFNVDKKKLIGSGLSAGLGYFGSNKAASDLKDGLSAQLAKLEEAQGQFQPFLDTGTAANQTLLDMLNSGELLGGFNPTDLENDPGYQFQLNQGLNALDRSMAAQGSLNSGRAIKGAQEYGQGLAAQTFDDAFRRYMAEQGQQFGQLSSLSGQGQSAANSLSALLGAQGGTLADMGSVDANNTVNNFNTFGNALSNLLGEEYFGNQYRPESLYDLLAGAYF